MDHGDTVIDRSVLAELRAVLGTGLDTVLDTFVAQVREAMAALPAMRDAGDLGELRGVGHRLKGAAGAMGARALLAEVTALEHAARDGDLLRVDRSCDLLPVIARATIDAIEAR